MSYLRAHDEHVAREAWESFNVITMKGPLGDLFVEYCTQCPLMKAFCLHTQNGWNDEGTVLTCYLCGEDGT